MNTSASSKSSEQPSSVPLSERLRRGDVMAPKCPSREILNHLTSRWGVLVLIGLLPGTLRFSQLRRKIGGVSERMLAQTLQLLEGDAMVERRAYDIVPPHVEYTLTSMGREAAVRVRELADWVEIHCAAVLREQEALAVKRGR
ncbi:helix-turn-helix domain-containing protein [Pseudomonas sp. RGM2987]|uniref:winged helix-turn-helix transcriptional regulator n=1 Tax=Pseudomonas sp. RGM2987 TaxID=2930090 RepID=UPI00246858F2|nr:helix-turn-helix domain-containing protein [Pseudomonas sp. RGM2987]